MTPPPPPSHGTGDHHRRARRPLVVVAAVATGVVLASGVTAFATAGRHAGTTGLGALPAARAVAEGRSPAVPARAAQPAPSAASPPARRANRSTPRPAPSTTTGPQARVLVLVNQQRARAGCRALTADARLAAVARAHSADMATRGYFDHVTPEGVDPGTRITRAGYAWSAYGENIAMGQPDAAAVMDAWMNSSGHRANILNCAFRDLGVGLAYDAGHRPYWTQDFGTPR